MSVTSNDPPPLCPNCDGPMVRKKAERTGKPFWGCQRWPECDGIVSIDEEYSTPEEQRRQERSIEEFRAHAALEIFKVHLTDPEVRASLWQRYMIDRSECRLAVELADDLIAELKKTRQ